MAAPSVPTPSAVRVALPTLGHNGKVWIGECEVSGVVSAVDVHADVHEMTAITLYLKPGSIDVTAEGVGKVSPTAHVLLVELGWTPPGEPAQ